MTVLAYTGIANPIQILNDNATNFQLTGSGSRTFTLDVNQNGTIQGFIGVVNILTNASSAGTVKVTFFRNGDLITSSTTDIATFNTNFGGAGVISYESLSILAGAQVFSGEVFTMKIETDAGIVSVNFDAAMTLVLFGQQKVYVGF